MKRLFAALLAALTLFSTGCRKTEEVITPEPPAPPVEEPAPDAAPPVAEILSEPEDPIEILLDSMTLAEKVGQLFFVRVPAEQAVEDVVQYHLGGYILFGRDTKDKTANEIIQNILRYQAAACSSDGTNIPLLIGVDEEGGTVVRVSSNPHLRSKKFLSPRRLLENGGLDAVAEETGEKDLLLRSLGFNVNLAPVADICTDPSAFMYSRSAGDADAATMYVEAMLARMSTDGIGSVLKHFPGYGKNVDTHTGIAVDDRLLETFRTSDFLPFMAGIQRGGNQTSVLMSHNIMTAVDAELPASLSPAVHDLLRTELGFDGVIMTDDLAMDAVAVYARDGSVARMAIEAGNDMLITTDYRTQIPKVIEAVENGALSEEAINTACRRVLAWKDALGLLTPDVIDYFQSYS